MNNDTVNLYETNAGHLTMVLPDGRVYREMECNDAGTFAGDAQALYEGWGEGEPSESPIEESDELIARWWAANRHVELVAKPGTAGTRYIGE